MSKFNKKNRLLGNPKLTLRLYRDWIEEDISPENWQTKVEEKTEQDLLSNRFFLENTVGINKPRII